MKPVKIGIAGLGRLGKVHAWHLNYQVPGAVLAAVCTHTEDGIAYARDELGNPPVYADFRDMLEQADLDAVVIVTASGAHCAQIEEALDAGKHVFCEKPLGTSPQDCLRAEAAVSRHPDRIFMLGFMRRYDESYVYAMEKIRQGAIGTPYLVKATSIDPDAQAEQFIRYTAHSAGIFLDLGIHDIDLMRWILGSEVAEIFALGGTFKHPEFRDAGDEETAVAALRFQNGAMGMLHIGRTAPHGYHVETEIVGTEGTIRISGIPQRNRAVLLTPAGAVTECVEGFQERFQGAYLAELREFIACVAQGRQPEVTVRDGVQSVVVAEAAKRAWQTGKPVSL